MILGEWVIHSAQGERIMDFVFAENMSVETLDKIPADFQGLYKKDGEKYVLDKENTATKSAVSAITRLNEALKASRAEAKNFKGQKVDLSSLSDFGTSPEEILASFKSKTEELEGKLAGNDEAKLNLDKIREDLAKGHAKDMEGKTIKIDALSTQLNKVMVESVAKSAVNEAKGDVDLLMPFVTKQVRNVEENGDFKVFVIDAQGDKRFSGVTGEPMNIVELVAEMKGSDKYAKLFTSEQKSGGGMPPGASNKSLGTTKPGQAEMSATEKISEGLKKGMYTRPGT
jgi:hypothetical protein